MEKKVTDIFKVIEKAIGDFQSDIPGVQKIMYDELLPIIKEFQISNGRLINNLQNLRLLGIVRNKLQKIIVNPRYKKSVEIFIESFGLISNLQLQYFSQFNKKYTPSKTLPIIRELTIDATVNDLVGQGMNSIVVSSVEEILRQNITTGGSYADLQKELENHIVDNYEGPGVLTKYTKQITTDAVNQYTAQVNEVIAQDLQFNWGSYQNSLITTSREFCTHMRQKDFFHRCELPELLKGNIDGFKCKLGKKTKIPLGMIPGTNPSNFTIRRGGYECRHQIAWIPDSSVPKEKREAILLTAAYKTWLAANPPKQKPPEPKK